MFNFEFFLFIGLALALLAIMMYFLYSLAKCEDELQKWKEKYQKKDEYAKFLYELYINDVPIVNPYLIDEE